MSLLLVQYSYLFSEEKQKEKEGQIYHICVVFVESSRHSEGERMKKQLQDASKNFPL